MESTRNTAGRIGLAALLLLAAIATWLSPLDEPARESVHAGTQRAFVTFASARGLNAVISALQGTEISVGVGASATFSVGEVLDPVNDLVEQFADLMLLATVAFGIQEVLLVMGRHVVLKCIVTALIVGWAAWKLSGRPPQRLLSGLLIVGLMARFAIPVATVGTEALFDAFLADRYQASEQVIAESAATGSPTDPAPEIAAPAEKGWLDTIREWSTEARDAGRRLRDVEATLDRLKSGAEQVARNVVQLIVVFLLQTLVIPLAVLWLLYAVLRNLLAA